MGGDGLLVSDSDIYVHSSAREADLGETCSHTCNFCIVALIYLKVLDFFFLMAMILLAGLKWNDPSNAGCCWWA